MIVSIAIIIIHDDDDDHNEKNAEVVAVVPAIQPG
jgi:hypothetical protein